MVSIKVNKSRKFLGKLFSLVKSFPKLLQKCAFKRIRTLRALLSNSRKLFEKSLRKNFNFCTRNRFSFFISGSLLSFSHNNRSTPSHGSKTKFCTKVLCYLSFKKVRLVWKLLTYLYSIFQNGNELQIKFLLHIRLLS